MSNIQPAPKRNFIILAYKQGTPVILACSADHTAVKKQYLELATSPTEPQDIDGVEFIDTVAGRQQKKDWRLSYRPASRAITPDQPVLVAVDDKRVLLGDLMQRFSSRLDSIEQHIFSGPSHQDLSNALKASRDHLDEIRSIVGTIPKTENAPESTTNDESTSDHAGTGIEDQDAPESQLDGTTPESGIESEADPSTSAEKQDIVAHKKREAATSKAKHK